MARRSIWERLFGRLERQRAIREHERADRGLLQTFAAGVLTGPERAALVERCRTADGGLGFRERLDLWLRQNTDWKDRVVREAEEPLRGKLSLFGKTYPLLDPTAWHSDPGGRRRWPRRSHMRIRLDNPRRPGDVRMQWEPARFHHALRLGRAYLATGDSRYPEAFGAQIDSFEAGNRPFDSIHWAVGMEVAIRAANLVFAIEFFRGCDLFTPERCNRLIDLLLLHGLFLESHIEIHVAGPTNHTIADYAGLIVLARAFEGTTIGGPWMDLATAGLEEAFERQVLDGGAHSEGSLPYERFVLETGLVAHSCLDDDRREKLDGLLLSMARHLRSATLSGRLPFVGDGDDSFFPPFGMRPLQDLDPFDPEPVLQVAAHHLGDDLLRSRSGTTEEAFWLGVPAGGQTSAQRRVAGHRSPGTLKTSGFFRFEVGAFEGLLLVRDRDEGWIPTHGHNDLLSIVLNYDGHPLLIDPGTGVYAWDRKLRHTLRSTASHSTLQVGKKEQSPISERRTFEGPLAPHCRSPELREDPLEIQAACHPGGDDPGHLRNVRAVFGKDRAGSSGGRAKSNQGGSEAPLIRIEDLLFAFGDAPKGSGRDSKVRFIFAPGLQPVQDRSHQSIWSVETPTGTVRFLSLHPKAADWQSLTVPASKRYGSKQMVASLVGTYNGSLNHRWVTFIAPPDWSVEELTAFADEQATEGK